MGLIKRVKSLFETPSGGAIIIIGLRWGDESKGKVAHAILLRENITLGVRYNGSRNAAHTIYPFHEDPKHKIVARHISAAAFVRYGIPCVGKGMLVVPKEFLAEIHELHSFKFMLDPWLPRLDELAQIIMPYHVLLDDLTGKIGTTKNGIGPAYSDKVARRGIRVVDLLRAGTLQNRVVEAIDYHRPILERYGKIIPDVNAVVDEYLKYGEALSPLVCDVGDFLLGALEDGDDVLGEGAQGAELDVGGRDDPYCTSSETGVAGFISGVGLPPKYIRKIIGVFKAYDTRVDSGNGPMLCEISGALEETIRRVGGEYGAGTGRPRRCGWLDAKAAGRIIRKNGVDELVLAKLDVLTGLPDIYVCRGYAKDGREIAELPTDIASRQNVEPIYQRFDGWDKNIRGVRTISDLPHEARAFIDWLENYLEVPIVGIGTGPGPDDMIWRY